MPTLLRQIAKLTDSQLNEAAETLEGVTVDELRFVREAVAMEQERRKPKERSRRAFCPGVSPPDNSCPPANKGEGKEAALSAMAAFLSGDIVQHVEITGADRLNALRPKSTEYDPKQLISAGDPKEYEGGELRDGQTLWDRYSVASSTYVGDRSYGEGNEISAEASVESVFSDPYSPESKQIRDSLNSQMPLRRQHEELKAVGSAAMQLESDRKTVEQFSSSVTNEMVSLMSDVSGSSKAEAKKEEEIARMQRVSPGEDLPSQQDVDRLVQLARDTELPEGVTLFHGIKGVASRETLESVAASRGTIVLQKLTSTTTRPSVATQFGKTTNERAAPQEDKTTGGELVHENGSLASVVRIRDASRGLPIGSASRYENEAEVVLAPGTAIRFTGESRVVFIPAGNDTGWPSSTFETRHPQSKQRGKFTRALWPVTVYDAVMAGGEE